MRAAVATERGRSDSLGAVLADGVAGVKTMAMLGRYRRRIATAALCALMAAGAFPRVLLDAPAQITRVAILAIRVRRLAAHLGSASVARVARGWRKVAKWVRGAAFCRAQRAQALLDDPQFHTDQSELDNLDFKGDLAEDRVLARRLAVTRNDPVRALKVHEAVRALLGGLAQALGGNENLLVVLSAHAPPKWTSHASVILSGDLSTLREESEEDARRLSLGDDDDDLKVDISD